MVFAICTGLRLARAGIPERWGYRTDWRGMLLTRAIDQVTYDVGLHRHQEARAVFIQAGGEALLDRKLAHNRCDRLQFGPVGDA